MAKHSRVANVSPGTDLASTVNDKLGPICVDSDGKTTSALLETSKRMNKNAQLHSHKSV